jgi:D-sedoheptulose 7-phosphate isomerase
MIDKKWYDDYMGRYRSALFDEDVYELAGEFKELLLQTKEKGGTVYFAGNGASAAIASHLAADFTKQGKVPSFTFNDPDFITCFANDFGYENWLAKALEYHAKENDVVVLISSSGNSPNVVAAAKYAREHNLPVVTFTGFSPENKLKAEGDINFWLDSKAYNIIECTHMIWMTLVVDMIVGNAEYSAS